MSETDILKMKVADLKRELKLRGLSTTGNKNELQERLQTSLLDGDLSLDDTAIPEGLLDDEVLTDEDEKAALDLSHDEVALKSLPKVEEKVLSEETSGQHKKVILKRKNSLTVATPTDTINSTTAQLVKHNIEAPLEKSLKLNITDNKTDQSAEDKDSTEIKKVVKLSELSLKDRLEMRAKKFGLPPSVEASKQARAERFGEVGKTANNSAIKVNDVAQVEVLKKRAERFGCSVSKQMTAIETAEKLKKREERFGSSASKTTDDFSQNAKERIERFKATVK